MVRLPVLALTIALVASLFATDLYAASFRQSSVTVVTDGGRYRFAVELAETPSQRRQGLQGRRSLAKDAGMLFDFGRPLKATMWMKNTPVALDMLFVRADGVIDSIAADTTPQSLEILRSEGEVLAVLEIAAGTARRLGIRPGHRVMHWIFDPAATPTRPPSERRQKE